jgi:cardiolipin synthase
VADRKIAVVGTAHMDYRSFDLNFEVNAIVYDEATASELADVFFEDIKDAEKMDQEKWANRSTMKKLWQKTARMVSPLL